LEIESISKSTPKDVGSEILLYPMVEAYVIMEFGKFDEKSC